MTFWSRHLGSTAIAFIITGSAAMADVTADQVWSDFKAYLESFGYTVTGTEQTSGGTLTLDSLPLAMEMPDNSGTASVALNGMSFTETGDGRVRVTLPASMPIAFTSTPPDGMGEDVAGTLDYTHEGFEMIVSGDPDSMVYDYGAAEMAFTLSSLIVGGTPVQIGEARMSLAEISGNSTSTGTDLRQIAQTMTAGAMAYVLDMANPDDPTGRLLISGGLENLGFTGTMALPDGVDMNDVAAAMQAGFSIDGGYSYETGASDMSITGEGQTFEGSTSSEAGRLTVRMDGTRMAYSGEATGVAMNYTGTGIPVPVNLEMGRAGFNMLFPISQTEEPTDFGLGLTLADVSVSDAIWGMVDPAGQLPRDPATIQIDLTGKARVTQDIMDEQAMMMATTPPGEIHALTVNALTLAIAGAQLVGQGDFTFDNTDMSTFPGMPRPEGALDLELTGGNTLLDTLVAMGLLPEEQAMGARMMLGLFARPGAGPDSLTSRIEINGEGQVLANGQRLR